MSLSPNKVVNKQLAQLFKGTYWIGGYLTKPYSCGPFKGGWKGSAHYLIRNPLKVHCSLKSRNVVKRITRSIVWIQGRHFELWRERVTVDECSERGISPMNQVLYWICHSHIFSHLIHDLSHLVHLLLQMWDPSRSGTPWLALRFSISSVFLTLGMPFGIPLTMLSPRVKFSGQFLILTG